MLQTIPMVFVASFFCFVIFQYLGNPVYSMLGTEASQKQCEEVTRLLGLDKPFYIQYLRFVKNICRGNFGMSHTAHRPVLELLKERLPASFELAFTGTAIAVLFAIPLGIAIGTFPKSPFSKVILASSLVGISVPTFLIGILAILVFGVILRWLPSSGRGNIVAIGTWKTSFLSWDGIRHLVMPALTLSMYQFAVLLRLIRAAMVETLVKDFVTTARAKGVGMWRLCFKHAFRNAFSSAFTMIVLLFATCFAYSLVVETVFQWPGLGNLIVIAVGENDQPVMVSFILFTALLIIILNLITDIVYRILDPRVRYD